MAAPILPDFTGPGGAPAQPGDPISLSQVRARIGDRMLLSGGDVSAHIVSAARATVSAAMVDRFGDVPNAIRDFGCPTDGTTDAGPALNAMFAAIPEGAPAFVPACPAGYSISTPVSLGKRVHFHSDATFHVNGSINAFCIEGSGYGTRFVGPTIIGTRAVGQNGLVVRQSRCIVANVKTLTLDNAIYQPTGAGFENLYFNIDGRNHRSRFIWFQDGVGPKLIEACYDTDGIWNGGSYAAPLGAGIHIQTEGVFLYGCDVIHAGGLGGLVFETSALRDLYWGFVVACTLDSTVSAPGIRVVNNTGAHVLRGLWFDGVWASSSQSAVLIDGTGTIDTVVFNGPKFINNYSHGINLLSGTDIHFSDMTLSCSAGNPASGITGPSGTAHSIYSNTPGYVQLRGGRVRGAALGFPQVPGCHLFRDTSAGIMDIDGTTFDASYSTAVLADAAPAGRLHLGRTPGMTL